MPNKPDIRDTIESLIAGTDLFIVDIRMNDHSITIELDSDKGITVNECALINKQLHADLSLGLEAFQVKVSSPGLNSPFKVKRQFIKNIGKTILVNQTDNTSVKGKLTEVNDKGILIEKRQRDKISETYLCFEQIKKAKAIIQY